MLEPNGHSALCARQRPRRTWRWRHSPCMRHSMPCRARWMVSSPESTQNAKAKDLFRLETNVLLTETIIYIISHSLEREAL